AARLLASTTSLATMFLERRKFSRKATRRNQRMQQTRSRVMIQALNRRRFISIAASMAGIGLLPSGMAAANGLQTANWRGQALGASASITVHHHDYAAADLLVNRAAVEVTRLERIFSLYRRDSTLSELNRVGVLA